MNAIDVTGLVLIKPLVKIRGGVRYSTRDVRVDTDGARETREWETVRVIEDTEERQRFETLQRAIRRDIRAMCIESSIGLLIRRDRLDAIDSLTSAYRERVSEINSEAVHSVLLFTVLTFELFGDSEGARDILRDEIISRFNAIERAIQAADSKRIRAELRALSGYEQALSPLDASRYSAAVKAAKESARWIVSAGEEAAARISEIENEVSTEPIDSLRFALLGTVPAWQGEPEPVTAPVSDREMM